jgi:hypothetical protein
VVVFSDDDSASYWLADGFHRFEAAQKAGRAFIKAEIREGGKREAILFAVGANASHGLRRRNIDKRNSVLKLLKDEEWSQWSDREIAKQCKVDHKTVARIRRELSGEIPQIQNPIRKVTRGGKTYDQNTRNIGRQRPRDKDLEENQRELEEAIENGELDLADVPVRLQRRSESAHTSLLPRCLVLPSSHLVTLGQMQFECPMSMANSCTCGEQPELINNFLATWENRIQSTWNHLTRDSKRIVLERLGLLVIQGRREEEVAVEEGDDTSDGQQSIIALVCEKNGLTEDELREKIRWLWEGPYIAEDRAEEFGITTEQLVQLEDNLSGSGRPWDDAVENTTQRPAEI